jgi:lipopolysaccharide export system protein LptA
MISRSKFGFCLGVAVLALLAARASAQQQLVVTDFSVVLAWHDPPFDKQMKSLLEGARAEPQPGNRYLVTDARLQTFLNTGQSQMEVKTPQCTYDSGLHLVNSPARLQVQTADGKFSIAGEGFLWQQTNSWLVISNGIQTTVHPDLLKPQTRSAAANSPVQPGTGVEIFSDRFDYTANSGLATYAGNVRVTGTNLTLTERKLMVKVPTNKSKAGLPGGGTAGDTAPVKLETITAEGNVVADYETPDHEKVHATGERASYSAGTDLLQVSGRPAWRSGERQGTADELVMDRTNKIFRAIGHAWLKLPSQTQSGAAFLPQIETVATDSPPATNQFLEIWSDSYEIRTNLALFRKDVRLSQGPPGQPKGTLSCGLLTATFAGTNQLQKLVAEQAVTLAQADKQSSNRFAAGKMVYTATNELVELMDKPTWQLGTRSGRGDFIQFDRAHMLVRGNAAMQFPAREFAPTGRDLARAQKPAASGKGTNELAEIFSEQYVLKRETNRLTARFQGGVYVTHPQMTLACETMDFHLPAAGRQVDSVIARQKVAFDLLSDKGQALRGSSEQAVYTYSVTPAGTNKVVELTGNPALETTNGLVRASVMILDLANGKALIPGTGTKYQIHSSVAAIDTNQIRWPRLKTQK